MREEEGIVSSILTRIKYIAEERKKKTLFIKKEKTLFFSIQKIETCKIEKRRLLPW